MPLIVAISIRYVIMAAVQLALWSLIEHFGLPLLNAGIAKVMEIFGVSEEDATTYVANSLLVSFEEVGIFAITLRTKLPISVAERLGFTSKGWNIRKLSPSAEKKLPKLVGVSKVAATGASVDPVLIAETVATARKIPVSKVKAVFDYTIKILGLGFLGTMVISNVIDFGNWNSGAYQKTLQKLIAVVSFGLLVPDPKVPKSSVLSADTWTRLYSTYKELGAVGINDPYKMQSVLFTRQNMIDLVDKIAATAVAEGQAIGLKQMVAATALMVIIIPPTGTAPTTATGAPSPYSPTASTAVKTTAPIYTPQVAKVSVVSGVISQGLVGTQTVFAPRQDDLIENADELAQAAHNNLDPFIRSMPGRMAYIIKIVPSVKTADGFTQRGTAQKIISGYTTTGAPKYRTVVNKFAVMDIFVRTDKGSQSKITTIVLGPVDSVKFQSANVSLDAVAMGVQQDITTNTSVTTTATAAPVENTATSPVAAQPTGSPQIGKTVYYQTNTNGIPQFWVTAFAGNIPWGNTLLTKEQYIQGLRERAIFAQTHIIGSLPPGYVGQTFQQGDSAGLSASADAAEQGVGVHAPGYTWPGYYAGPITPDNVVGLYSTPQGETTATVAPVTTKATTLFDYYKAQGQSLPSVQERSVLYEQLGLGQATYYTGTAEQNIKLLAAVQGAHL